MFILYSFKYYKYLFAVIVYFVKVFELSFPSFFFLIIEKLLNVSVIFL